MNIFMTGATGFIGSRLAHALHDRGHTLALAVRNPKAAQKLVPGHHYERVDFNTAVTAETWQPLLTRTRGGSPSIPYDVVINAVGILQETPRQRFHTVHSAAPIALFDACVATGVRRIVQISALGADAEARTAYHLSKRAADEHLRQLPSEHVIAQPALVFGPGGTSARLFSTLARLPVIPLPGRGDQQVQPIYVDDLIDAVVALVETPSLPASTVPLVGPHPVSLRAFYAQLRRAQGLRAGPIFIPVPMAMMRLTARLASWIPGGMLDRDTLDMLNRGNTGDPSLTRLLIGRDPRPVDQFFA